MRHRYGFKELSRNSSERKALLRAQCTSLIMAERIITTLAKAKATQRLVEKVVTRARNCNNEIAKLREGGDKESLDKANAINVHNHRMSKRVLYTEEAVAKLYNEIAPLFKERNGGYTRIIKISPRRDDAARMAILEFVNRTESSEEDKKERKKKKEKAKKSASEIEANKKRKEERKLARANRVKESSGVKGKVNSRQKVGGSNG